MVSDDLINFGTSDLISKVKYMISGSRGISLTDKDFNFKFGMGTLLGKFCEAIEFEAAMVHI